MKASLFNVVVAAKLASDCDAISLIQKHAGLKIPKAVPRQAPPSPPSTTNDWELLYLDESEVASRGSFCMDGSAPGYFFKNGTAADKWTITLQGGSMFCYDEESCRTLLNGDYIAPTLTSLELYEQEAFKDFNHVQLSHCDGGLYMGDSAGQVSYGSQRFYSRGKRIIDHLIETLQASTSFGSATQVLVTGGSGGGQAALLLADYMKGIMPSSVSKFAALPMSGLFTANPDHMSDAFSTHGMSSAIVPKCIAAFSQQEQYKCLQPAIAYQYASTKMFVIQMLDSQSLEERYYDNDTLAQDASDAWSNCVDLASTTGGSCTTEGVNVLNDYLEELVGTLQSSTKYNTQGEGGFLSTCTKHVFYKEEEYKHYANNGVTIEDAVSNWWQNLDTASAKWYLPCELNAQQPQHCQCEDSCMYDSGSTD